MASVVLSRPPDPDVELAILYASICRATRTLPRAGGFLDQDPDEMKLLLAGLNAFAAKDQKEADEMRAKMRQQQH